MAVTEQVTGAVTISLGFLSAVFLPKDFAEWATVVMQFAPFALILFLIWRVAKMDSQLKECRESHERVTQQLLLSYAAIRNADKTRLPSPQDFIDGNFNLKDCVDDHCDIKGE